MTGTFRKRRSECEVLSDVQEPKRFHAKETEALFLHLLQLEKFLADEEELDESAYSEEMVNRVMRSLEEEIISTTYSTSHTSSNNKDSSKALDISNCHGGKTLASDSGIDLCHLLEASDDELGIPPSSVVDLKDKVCQSLKETSEGLSESPDFKSFGENWHFQKHFENYQQFQVYENPTSQPAARFCQPKNV